MPSAGNTALCVYILPRGSRELTDSGADAVSPCNTSSPAKAGALAVAAMSTITQCRLPSAEKRYSSR